MDDGGGLTINISSAKAKPARKKMPKPSKAPSSWGSSDVRSKSTTAATGSTDPIQRSKDRLKATLKKKKKTSDQDGGRPKPADNKPFYASLFSHNPEVPELDLPESGEPAQPDVFSGEDFSSLQIHPHLVANVTKALGGAEMTRVQQRALPPLLAGGDCLVRSQTGSGKTLAYLLPVIQGLQAMDPPITRESGLFALIIVPTRELALQTYNCAAQLMKAFVRLVPGYLTGGEKTICEKRRLRRGLNLLVATPGRLLAHVASSRNLRLGALRWLVLDEADLLLDMGYEKHVRSIVDAVCEQRTRISGRLQTVLLSATLDDRVQKLAGLSLSDPTFIDASSDDADTSRPEGELVTPGQLRQFVAIVPAKLRMVALASFILWKCSTRDESKMIVFMNTNDMVDYHHALLGACLPSRGLHDLNICKLHGNMPQTDRTGVFTEFRKARSGLLLCTDVAARGVDLPHVNWIVQYTPPCRAADYVHRVGRTARAGGGGNAVAFLAPAEAGLVQMLRDAGLSVSDMGLETILSVLASSGGNGGRPTSLEEAATQLQCHMEETVAHDWQLADMARRAFTSLTRSYATYPSEMKAMLSVRTLHLGHYAKSLCLRETPTALGRYRGEGAGGDGGRFKRGEKRPASDGHSRPRVRIPQSSDISEFSSGLDGGAGTVRKPKKKKARNT